jgi:hypothetical protein
MPFSPLLADAGTTAALVPLFVIAIGLVAYEVYCYWRIFEKAGRPGWLAIIPIVNFVVLLRIIGRSPLWLLVLLIPGVDLAFAFFFFIWVNWDLGKSFGKGIGFRFGLLFLNIIFVSLLAFDNSHYTGPSAGVLATTIGDTTYVGR